MNGRQLWTFNERFFPKLYSVAISFGNEAGNRAGIVVNADVPSGEKIDIAEAQALDSSAEASWP